MDEYLFIYSYLSLAENTTNSKWHGDTTFDMASVFAVLRVMVIVGECTKYLSNETKERGADSLPFNNIESVRNLLAHANRPAILRQLRLFVAMGTKEKEGPLSYEGQTRKKEEEEKEKVDEGKMGDAKEIPKEEKKEEKEFEENKQGDEKEVEKAKPGSPKGKRRRQRQPKKKQPMPEEPPIVIDCRGLLKGLVEKDFPELRDKMSTLASQLDGSKPSINNSDSKKRWRHADVRMYYIIGIAVASLCVWLIVGVVVGAVVGVVGVGWLVSKESQRATEVARRREEKWSFLHWESQRAEQMERERVQKERLVGYLESAEVSLSPERKELFVRALNREATLRAEDKTELFKVLRDKERIKEWCGVLYPSTKTGEREKGPKTRKITKEERKEKMRLKVEHNKVNKEKKGLDNLRTLRKLLSVPMNQYTKNPVLEETVRDAMRMIEYIQDLYR